MEKGKQCDGRILKESLVQEVVIEAFNRLPDYRDELIRKQEQIRGLPLLRLKQELEQVEDQKDQLEMAISTFAETGRLPENSSFRIGEPVSTAFSFGK